MPPDEGAVVVRLPGMTPRPLFVHVGLSKSGTSALQRHLWSSVEPLADAGVGLPLVGRTDHVRKLLVPLGYRAVHGFTRDVDRSALRDLGAQIRDTPGDRLLMSVEDLAEADADRVKLLGEMAQEAGTEVHVVLTARNLAKQLPSEWQQFLKHRRTIAYPDFLEEVRSGTGEDGDNFWWRQHLPRVCERWSLAAAGPERVHVVSVPPVSEDASAVYRLFGSVVGFDHTLLNARLDVAVNESYGYLEAEMLRRVNLALGDRLTDFEKEYQPAVRKVLVRQVIERGASSRITLPPEHLDWVRRTAEQWVTDLRERGYQLYGDPATLVPGPDVARPLPELDDAEMASRAVRTLADFAVRVFETQGARRHEPAPSAEPDGRENGAQVRRPWRRLLRR